MESIQYDTEQWRQFAACGDMNVADFFPEEGANVTLEIKIVCRGCPVRNECLDFAIRTKQKYGVWGGYNEQDRRRTRRKSVALIRARNREESSMA